MLTIPVKLAPTRTATKWVDFRPHTVVTIYYLTRPTRPATMIYACVFMYIVYILYIVYYNVTIFLGPVQRRRIYPVGG